MVQEFGYTREIEDRVLAPLPVALVAVEKVVVGRAQRRCSPRCSCSRSPRSSRRRRSHLDINWPVLLTLTPLACYMCGALGLTFGTRFEPRTVPMLFGIIVIPLTFLGCDLLPVAGARADPLAADPRAGQPARLHVRGFRAALTPVDHMSLWAVYPALLGFSALFTWLGINGFKRRVLA